MSEDLKALADKRKPDFKGLQDRMDADKKLYLLDPYILRDFKGKPIPKVVSSTLNDPGTFACRSIAILASADPQVVVESDNLKANEESPVEEFIPALEYEADIVLANKVRGVTFPFFCEQSCVRGWLAGMNLLRIKNNRLIPDRRPLDSRCVTYDVDMDGLIWGGYEAPRSQAKIFSEYKHDIRPKDKEVVLNIYSRTHNQVWVGGEKVKDREHSYRFDGKGYVPMVIQPMPTGSMLQDGDTMAQQGESIFQLDRGLYPKMNEMASILENLTMASFFAAKQYESEAGEAADQPEALPFGLGVIVSVEKGGGYRLIPVSDIRNATRLLYAIYENRIQRGSLPAIDFGNLSFPLSGAAIARLTESKDMIFVPRLQGLAMFYQQWDRMAIKQYIEIGKNLRLGEEGHRKIFPVAGLKGEYTIFRRYFPKQPEQDIANISIYNAAGDAMSKHTKRRTILKLRDPDAEDDLLNAEFAEELNPVIKLKRQVHSLINREEYLDAELTLQSAEDLLRQRATGGAITQLPQGAKKEPKSLMPLLDEGGGGGGRRKTEGELMEEEMGEEERIGRLAETARAGREKEK